MKTKTKVKAGRVTANHNETLASGIEFDRKVVVEIEEKDLETIAAALRVHTGLQAGSIQPCL